MNKVIIFVASLLLCFGCNDEAAAKSKPKSKETKPEKPSVISKIDGRKLSPGELVFVASLQGVAAKQSPRIFIEMGEQSFWIPQFEKSGYTFESVTLKEVTDRYIELAAGYVLADLENVSVAATVAGPLRAAVLTPEMAERTEIVGALPMLADVRGKTEQWLLEYVKANPKSFSYEGILQHNPSRPHTLVDYTIAGNRICIVGKGEPELVADFYSLIEPNMPRLGWGAPFGDEREDVSLGAEHGLFTIPASNTLNLTFFTEAQPPKAKKQKAEKQTPLPEHKSAHYVMILMSDGDNLNWCIGGCVTSDKWLSNPHAPGNKISWMFPPLVKSFVPVVYDYYRNNLPKDNYLLGGVSGAGYTYPSLQKEPAQYAKLTGRALRESALDYCIIMDVCDFRTKQRDVLKNMLDDMPDVKGLYYMDYGNYAKWRGDYYKINGIPVVSMRYRLWLPMDPLETIAEKINASSRDVNSLDAYSPVVVHVWSYTTADVARFIGLLDDDVVLLDAAEFMETISKNVEADDYK